MKKSRIILIIAVAVIAAVVAFALVANLGGGTLAEQLSLGERYMSELDYEAALLAYKTAIEIDPRSADAYLGMAEALVALGRLEEALEALALGFELTGDARIEALLAELSSATGLAEYPHEPLELADAALEAALREAAEKPEGDLYLDDFNNVTVLFLSNRGIRDISGIERLTYLMGLYMDGNNVTDFSPLYALDDLCNLEIDHPAALSTVEALLMELPRLAGIGLDNGDAPVDLPAIVELVKKYPNVTSLDLAHCGIKDASPLAELDYLTELVISYNEITDLSPLSGMKQLWWLYIDHNGLSDLSPLESCEGLTHLYFYNNEVSDISPLAGLDKLVCVSGSFNKVSDLSPLAGLENLREVGFSDNSVTDWSPVAHVATVYGRD